MEQVIVILIVCLAGGYLLRWTLKKLRSGGCGGSSAPKKPRPASLTIEGKSIGR